MPGGGGDRGLELRASLRCHVDDRPESHRVGDWLLGDNRRLLGGPLLRVGVVLGELSAPSAFHAW